MRKILSEVVSPCTYGGLPPSGCQTPAADHIPSPDWFCRRHIWEGVRLLLSSVPTWLKASLAICWLSKKRKRNHHNRCMHTKECRMRGYFLWFSIYLEVYWILHTKHLLNMWLFDFLISNKISTMLKLRKPPQNLRIPLRVDFVCCFVFVVNLHEHTRTIYNPSIM